MQQVEVIDNTVDVPRFEDGIKLSAEVKLSLWSLIMPDPTIPSSMVLALAITVSISVRHLNRLRAEWNLNGTKGRPRKQGIDNQAEYLPVPISFSPNVTFIGVHLFACWLEAQDIFPTILTLMKQAILIHSESHPSDSFPLLHHRDDTLMLRFKALFYASLFGIGKLIEFDEKEHPLRTLIGRGYQGSTLNQYLGQLERIDAAPILMDSITPTSIPCGISCFIDGHMFPFWTSISMHKGKITMLGRIMPGSQAIVAHIEDGRAIFFDYQAPDIRMPKMIMNFCGEIVTRTGMNIFVIDREINSVEIAREFTEKGWGLLSMLDGNEYTDMSDWDNQFIGNLNDGAEVYVGTWAEGKEKKVDDPRVFVIVVREGRILPYWGTRALVMNVPLIRWPALYSARTEIQENSFRRMKEHGALDVNFGIKKIVSDDRHHQRKVDELESKRIKTEERLTKKEEEVMEQERKVQESVAHGHGKRFEQRQEKLEKLKSKVAEEKSNQETIKGKLEALGLPGKRADRDFRKQSIMTLRTLLLENQLMAFFSLLMHHISGGLTIGMDSFIGLLFKRSGGFYETPSEMVYWVSMDGLSKYKKQTMLTLIDGINKMGLAKDGKSVRVLSRGHPISC